MTVNKREKQRVMKRAAVLLVDAMNHGLPIHLETLAYLVALENLIYDLTLQTDTIRNDAMLVSAIDEMRDALLDGVRQKWIDNGGPIGTTPSTLKH